MEYLGYIGLLFVFGAILFLAYVTTKFIGNKTVGTLKGKYINIIESVSIGMDKQLYLVKVADQFVLIASSGKNIKFLTNVEIEGYEPKNAGETEAAIDFKTILGKYLPGMNTNLKKGEDNKISGESVSNINGKNFSVNLSRLKTITSNVDKVSQKDRDGDNNEF